MYGAGSARDWAAKGTRLLGIKAVIAESFERIHRSNLVRLGVLPLAFEPGVTREGLQIMASDTFALPHDVADLKPLQRLVLRRRREDGREDEIPVVARVDTLDELRYLRDGGIQPSVAQRLFASG
jgi:aconitate hydratase